MLEAVGEDDSHGAIFEPQLPSRCLDGVRKSMLKIVQSRDKETNSNLTQRRRERSGSQRATGSESTVPVIN